MADASARSEGCSIIQASASMLAQMTLGKSLEQVESVADRFRSMMQRKPTPGEDMGGLEDLLPLQVVRQFPVRIKCALLPWTALEIGIEDFRARNRLGRNPSGLALHHPRADQAQVPLPIITTVTLY